MVKNYKTFKYVSMTMFLGSLLTLLPYNCNRLQEARGFYRELSRNDGNRKMVEEHARQRLEYEQSGSGSTLDTEFSVGEMQQFGKNPNDNKPYFNPNTVHGINSQSPKGMNASALLLAALENTFSIEQQKRESEMDASQEGLMEWINPKGDKEKDKQFGLEESLEDNVLSYNRETSYIIPRGQRAFSKEAQQQEKAPEIEQQKRALIMLDISGSMCANKENYDSWMYKNTTYSLFKPSILALTIAQFYTQKLDVEVCGFSFSNNSHATQFTKSLADLATHYSQLECGGTKIDFDLVEKVVRGTNTSLDVYIITDNDILNTADMSNNINSLKDAMGKRNTVDRTFFIEWRDNYNQEREDILYRSSLPNAYYATIGDLGQIKQLYESLNEKLGKVKDGSAP